MIRTLLTTTALSTALLIGGAFAQDATTAGPSNLLDQGYEIIDTDGLASKLIGTPVYTSAAADAEHLGDINDLVVNADGQVAAVVIGVGGFLGVGEKNVAVAYTDLDWVQAEDNTERLVLQTTQEALNAAPAVELIDDEPMDTAAAPAADDPNAVDNTVADDATDMAAADPATDPMAPADDMAADDSADVAVAPAEPVDPAADPNAEMETGAITPVDPNATTTMEPLNREGLVDFDELTLTAEDLIGTNVYGPTDEHIGVIGDFVLGEDGQAIDAVIIDFGGFLGIGTKEVAVAFDNLNFLADENGNNRYLVLNVTREQMDQAVAFNRDTYPNERETQRLTVSAL